MPKAVYHETLSFQKTHTLKLLLPSLHTPPLSVIYQQIKTRDPHPPPPLAVIPPLTEGIKHVPVNALVTILMIGNGMFGRTMPLQSHLMKKEEEKMMVVGAMIRPSWWKYPIREGMAMIDT